MVLNIALCDDSDDYGEIISSMIKIIMHKNKIEYNISRFYEGNELIRAYAKTRFDIIILDMEMPGLNGIETGHIIREVSEKAIIIYLTSHKEYAYESYKVKAKDYLLKPVKLEELEKALLNCINEKPKEFLDVKDDNGIIHRLPVKEITHILRKKEDRKLHIFTLDKKEIVIVQTLESMEIELISNESIVRSSKSCMINMENVRTIVKNVIYFINDSKEYASRRCLSNLVNKLNINRG